LKRRSFIALSASIAVLPHAAFAEGFVDYRPGLIQSELAAGKTLLVDYSATWCSTCARQERVIEALRGQNAAYDEALSFIKVDWDTYRSHAVTKSRGIPRRSTLLILRGEDELGRIVAGTRESDIQALMDLAL